MDLDPVDSVYSLNTQQCHRFGKPISWWRQQRDDSIKKLSLGQLVKNNTHFQGLTEYLAAGISFFATAVWLIHRQ